MASFNKAIIAGNCGKDPEVRYLQSGMAVANVSVATSRKRKDKNTGETIEETQWHRIVFYDKLAEIVGEYVKKGTSILVEGSIKYGKYEKEDGSTVYTTDIVADSMQMLGSRSDNGGQQQPQRQQQPQGQRQAPQQQRPQGNAYQDARGGGAPRQQPQRGGSGFEDMDDDIPF